MRRAKIADLKNNLSRYLAYVREGGEVLVLDRQTPVARLVPFGHSPGRQMTSRRADAERLAEMERTGLVKRGSPELVQQWLDAHRPVALPGGAGSVLRSLLEMRAEDAR